MSDISTARFLITEPVLTPVTRVAASDAQHAAPTRPLWKRAAPVALVVMFALAALIGGAVWSSRPPPSRPAVARFSFALGAGQNFTGSGRRLIAMSPDGTQMAFVVDRQLYLRDLASLDARPIPRPATTTPLPSTAVTTPVFSPDGRSLAFFSGVDQTLKRIAVTGGPAVTICPADNPFGISWDDSGIIFGQSGKGILRVAANGGRPEQLASVGNDEFADSPQLLPGGKPAVHARERYGHRSLGAGAGNRSVAEIR